MGLLIYPLPIEMSIFLFLCGKLIGNRQRKFLSYPFQLFYCGHYVKVSFLDNIIRFNQLIISENQGNKVIGYDSYNKQHIPCINKGN